VAWLKKKCWRDDCRGDLHWDIAEYATVIKCLLCVHELQIVGNGKPTRQQALDCIAQNLPKLKTTKAQIFIVEADFKQVKLLGKVHGRSL